MSDVNVQFLISLIIIILGWMGKQFKWYNEEDGKSISKIILNITFPGLILKTFSTITLNFDLILMPLICLGYSLLMAIFAHILFRKYPAHLKGIFTFSLLGFNIGLFALPMVKAIWGLQGLSYLMMFDIANAVVIFIFSYSIALYFSPDSNGKINFKDLLKKLLTFVPLITYIAGIIINLFNLNLPDIVDNILDKLSTANNILILLLLGILFNLADVKSYAKHIAQILSVRYVFGIICGSLLYWLLPLSNEVRVILFILLILPVGFSVILYSVEFKYDERFAGSIVNVSNAISFILMWMIASFLA